MTIDRGLLDRLRMRGEEVLTQISAELMANPRFVKAVQGAIRGREMLEQAAANALREMNVPTRSDLRRANSRIEALEREMAELRGRRRGGPRRAAARKTVSRPASTRAAASRGTAARKAAARRSRPKTPGTAE
jgi:polyhydroxyalkanoate synthesis regulator phasin